MFLNPTAEAASVTYTAHIPRGAVVTAFKATFVDGTISGVVKEKEAAKTQFRSAVSRGQQAAIMEQSNKDDVFRCQIGNLAGGERVTVNMAVSMSLTAVRGRSGHARVVLPLQMDDPAFKASVVESAQWWSHPRPQCGRYVGFFRADHTVCLGSVHISSLLSRLLVYVLC